MIYGTIFLLLIIKNGTVIGELFSGYINILITIFAICNWKSYYKINKILQCFLIFGVMCVILILGHFDLMISMNILAILSIVLLISLNQKSVAKLQNILIVCLNIIAIHSLLNWLVISFIREFLNFSTVDVLNTNLFTFYGAFNFYLPNNGFDGFFGFPRNSGVFIEPGILQLYLNLLLFFKLFGFSRNVGWSPLLPIISLIVCQSSAGLILMLIQLCVFSMRHARHWIIIMLLIFAIGPLALTLTFQRAPETLIYSAGARIIDSYFFVMYPISDVKTFLLGDVRLSIDREYYIRSYQSFFSNLGLSNINAHVSETLQKKVGSPTGLFKIYAYHGIVLFALFWIGIVKLSRKLYGDSGWLFAFIIFVALVMSSIHYSMFLWLCSFSGYLSSLEGNKRKMIYKYRKKFLYEN
jgi:hypothetical protein